MSAAACACPTCAARHQRMTEAAARARGARQAASAAARQHIAEAIGELWRMRPRLRENLALTARRIVRQLDLDPGRERSVRRVAGLVRSGQTLVIAGRCYDQGVVR